MKNITITNLESNQRIDKYVRKYLNEAPLSFIYRLFRKKDIKVNGHWVKENYIIQENDVVSIYVTDSQLEEFNKPKEALKKDLNYPIIYEDENILIINKPRGVLVHGDQNEKRITLANEVLNYLYFKGQYNPKDNKGFIPAPAHRLDRNTSGLIMFAKNLESLQILEQLLKDKNNLEKHYLALVVGKIDSPMEIDAPLIKNEKTGLVKVGNVKNGALSAKSVVVPYQNFKQYSLVDVNLITGRTHQIRVHLSYINHPIIGDSKYGNFTINRQFKEQYNFENQFLHAYKIIFKNVSGKLSYLSNKTFEIKLNKQYLDLIKKIS